MSLRLCLILSVWLTISFAASAFACESIHGLIDVNCDGKFKIAVVGDSIGRGSRGNLRAAGSFVKRIAKSLRFATIKNLSIPGLDTSEAIRYLTREFPKNDYKVTKSLLNKADFVLVQVGINDYFSSTDPQVTIGKLKRIVSIISNYGESHGGVPLISIALITPVRPITANRAAQAEFVRSLNQELVAQNSPELPADVKFSEISETDVLASDGIHPDTNGHARMTKILLRYINSTFEATE